MDQIMPIDETVLLRPSQLLGLARS